jgi:hypothetical protein
MAGFGTDPKFAARGYFSPSMSDSESGEPKPAGSPHSSPNIFRGLRPEQFLDRLGDGPTNLGVERVPHEPDSPVTKPD